MAGDSEAVTIAMRVRGEREVARATRQTARNVEGIGTGARRAAPGVSLLATRLEGLGRSGNRAGISLRQVGGAVIGWKVAGMFRAAAAAGVDFNRMQDSQRVGFTTLLKSGDKAARMMADIQALALRSPVLDPGTTGDSARLLMAYGVAAKDALPWVEALGDMSAATGKDILEVMPRGAMAIGQVASKGRLQAEELNQLAESVGLSRDRIREALGETRNQFAEHFKPGGTPLSSAKALPAILEAMRTQSKGAAELLSKTPAGQIAAAKERGKIIAGSMTRPLYDRFGKAAGDLSKVLQGIWTDPKGKPRKDLSLEEKLKLSEDAAKRVLDPLGNEAERFWKEHHVGERLAQAVEDATPALMNAAGHAGAQATGMFVRAWWHAGPWGKLITAAFLGSKLGAFRFAGGMAADIFVARYKRRVAGEAAADALAGSGRGAGRIFGRALGIAAAAAATIYVAEELSKTDFVKGLADKIGVDLGLIDPKDVRDKRDAKVRRAAKIARDSRRHPIGGGTTGPAINLGDVAAGHRSGTAGVRGHPDEGRVELKTVHHITLNVDGKKIHKVVIGEEQRRQDHG